MNRPPIVAIGAIFKNEGPYILEWVAFHRAVGVDRFFIADNDSDDGSTELLAALQAIDVVEHIPFPHVPGKPPQLPAYAEIMRRHAEDADWIAFIDADEFLVPTDGSGSIRSALETADGHVGAVGINWAIYGSSFQRTASQGLVIERFTRRAERDFSENYHYKTVLRTSAYLSPGGNPHHFKIKREAQFVHVNGKPVVDHPTRGSGLSQDINWGVARINHYAVKSRDEFDQKKSPRGSATVLSTIKGNNYFDVHDRNEVGDPVPPGLIGATKEEMERIRAVLRENYCRDPIAILDETISTISKRHKTTPHGQGHVDSLSVEDGIATLRGWAITGQNTALSSLVVKAGDQLLQLAQFERVPRPDVTRTFPGADKDAGFSLSFSVGGLPENIGNLTVRAIDGTSSWLLHLSPDLGWPDKVTAFKSRGHSGSSRK